MNIGVLWKFSSDLFELLSSGIGLHAAIEIMSENNAAEKKISEICNEIKCNMTKGISFSMSLKLCEKISFPEWFCSFIDSAETNGNSVRALENILKILEVEKKSKEKFSGALFYPVFIAILALAGSFYVVTSFCSLGAMLDSENLEMFKDNAYLSCLKGSLFLLSGFGTVFFLFRKLFSVDMKIPLLKSLGLLIESGVPMISAIECSFSLIGKENILYEILAEIKYFLLKGDKVSKAFSKAFCEHSFLAEGILLEKNLELCEASGRSNGFIKTAEILEKRNMKKQKMILDLFQPFLIFLIAIYLMIILKNTFIPVITGFGGVS